MVATVVLMMLKMRFLGWPLYPVALPIASAYITDHYLAAIFLAWLVKATVIRYGGLGLHRKALPFFLGLIVGSAVLIVLCTALSCIIDVPLTAYW